MWEQPLEAQNREREALDNEFRSEKVHQPIPVKESAVQIILARKRYPQKGLKDLDRLCKFLALGSVVQKNQNTSVKREPRKRDVTVRNSDIAKMGSAMKGRQNSEIMLIDKIPVF